MASRAVQSRLVWSDMNPQKKPASPNTKTGDVLSEGPPGFGERLAIAIENVGGIVAASGIVGVTYESLSNWRDGKSKPSLFGVLKLAKAAGVSLDWLTAGEEVTAEKFVPIASLDNGGEVSWVSDGALLALHRDRASGLFKTDVENLALFLAAGDGMEPTVRGGDLLLIDTSTKAITINGLYLLCKNDASALYRVQRLNDETFILKLDNPAYEDQRFSKADVEAMTVCGLVRAVARLF